MNDDHLESFTREGEENIVDLNNALLALEDDPSDREAIDLIFRTAHTLKGNFAAMGFEDASALAHAIEDLLDEIRAGRMEVTPAVMDLVFEAVDEIETILGEIEAEGEVELDSTPTIDELRALIDSRGGSVGDPEAPDESARGDARVTEETLERLRHRVVPGTTEGPVTAAAVELDDPDMPGVDATLVLESIEDEFELLATVPDRSDVEAGAFSGTVALLVPGDRPGELADALETLGPVTDAAVESVPDFDDPGPGEGEAANGKRRGSPNEIKSVRVDVDQLDDLYSLVEQLVTSRIKLRRSIAGDGGGAAENLDELDKITTDLQDTVMDMRLVPLRKVVDTFPRLVRDLARNQEKEIDFEMDGTDIELDRTILDEISDPLMHVLRNAVDHGIEPPAEREAAGKPREGRITLEASRERDHVHVVVEDDGAGLDPEAIRETAIERGVLSAAEAGERSDEAVYDLIFDSGFSTSREVTDVSGRGVGMDVVRSTVNRLDGSVDVSSEPGSGTTVSLELPVTMAIVRVLFIQVGDREFGLPIKAIDEITPVEGIRTVNGREMIDHDDEIYPVLDLGERLTDSGLRDNGDGKLLKIRASERRVALHCDGVSRQEEVVIKPFEGSLGDVPGMSGTAVVGDGQVVPIIDVGTL